MSVFSSVLGNKVGRSVFDLSHVKRFTCDMGQLIPVYFDECVPGDTRKIGMQCVTRFQPLVAPILDSVDLTVHYFFVPTRLLMDKEEDWNTFLTGGVTGTDESVSLPPYKFIYMDGSPTNSENPFSNGIVKGKYSLWDYFGLPLSSSDNYQNIVDVNGVNGFCQRCYNLVWNEFYRDQNLVGPCSLENATLLYRSWKKDYFTSALPWQQRGVAPALPLSGTLPVDNLFGNDFWLGTSANPVLFNTTATNAKLAVLASNASPLNSGVQATYDTVSNLARNITGVEGRLHWDKNSFTPSVNLANSGTFDVAMLRQAFQIQRWMELNARGGVRYTEFLRSHFGISPRDEVLGRPQYIGGTKSSIVISEVLQTSQTTETESSSKTKGSPQGNLAGHGLGATSDYICTYTAKEFGYIIGIASWMPKPSYQQGVNRIFTRKTKFDFYFPEFAHLSEQAVTKGEIYATGTGADKEIFGYQGVYNEMRYTPSFNCADMRDTFSYWHLGRIFTEAPSLNAGFLTTNSKYSGGIRKDIFASQNEPGLLVQFANIVKAVRPLPVYGTPGFVDHVGRM